jgi:quercetin dioxygenase-like cupin family protein
VRFPSKISGLVLLLPVFAVPVTGSTAEVELLLKSGKSWDGGTFQYPPGDPEISILRIRLEEGQETSFHCHPVPTFGYLLKGTLEVKTSNGQTTVINEGQAAIEVTDTLHRGKAIAGPVEILVIYAGARNLENSIPKGKAGCS